jgi:hypothetical protein
MTKRALLLKTIEEAPDPMVDEVLRFVETLRRKDFDEIAETALASEYVLGRDWLLPEEDEAWKDLRG